MPSPLIVLTFGTIKPGKLDEYLDLTRRVTEAVESREPRVIALHSMVSSDGQRFASLQLHPDSESMELHLQVVRDLMQNALDVLEVTGFKVMGPSSAMVDGFLGAMAAAGVDVDHLPDHAIGFTRSAGA